MNLIGLSGLAGAGKSEAARILVEQHGFAEVALADPMKRACADWFGWDANRLWGRSENRNAPDPAHGGVSARDVLQRLGTEVGRELYPNLWVEYALRTASALLTPHHNPKWAPGYSRTHGLEYGLVANGWRTPTGVVVPDVRFRNELDAIHAAGGQVIRIVRASAGLAGTAAAHRSETEQASIPDDAFDGVIFNDSTVEDLSVLLEAFVATSSRRAS